MSTSDTKRPLAEALRDATAFKAMFPADTYERWEFAGSVRRGKPEVGDIEHVVLPRFGDRSIDGTMFMQRVNLLWHRLDELIADGTLAKHWYGSSHRWGEKYRGVDFKGFNHELFTADANNWGSQLLIRTGPAEFSQMVVTRFKDGGMYRQQDGYLVHVASGEIVPVPDEEAYFRMCGMAPVRAEERT